MHDWPAGIAQLMLCLSIRLSGGSELPWILMGMAHPLVARAVHRAGRCIEMYDAKPEWQHHRLSVRFLKIGTVLRISIDSFIEAKDMPPISKLHVSISYFIPFGDRQIEREHKYMSDIVTQSQQNCGRPQFWNQAARGSGDTNVQ